MDTCYGIIFIKLSLVSSRSRSDPNSFMRLRHKGATRELFHNNSSVLHTCMQFQKCSTNVWRHIEQEATPYDTCLHGGRGLTTILLKSNRLVALSIHFILNIVARIMITLLFARQFPAHVLLYDAHVSKCLNLSVIAITKYLALSKFIEACMFMLFYDVKQMRLRNKLSRN